MSEHEPLSGQLLEKHSKTVAALARIPTIMSRLDGELLKLRRDKRDYPEDVFRIGEAKRHLQEKACPTLELRKKKLESSIFDGLASSEQTVASKISDNIKRGYLPGVIYEEVLVNLASQHITDVKIDSKGVRDGNQEISQKINELLKDTGKKALSIVDIAKILGFKAYVYGNDGVIPKTKLIREAAQKLKIAAAYEKNPHFFPEDAGRIINELTHAEISQKEKGKDERKLQEVSVVAESDESAEDKNRTVLFRGKKIIFAHSDSTKIRILKILAETSKEKPIFSSVLAKAVYGDEISLVLAKKRMSVIFPTLQKKLGKYNLIIAKKNVKGDERLKSYYLADKSDIVEEDSIEKEPTKKGSDELARDESRAVLFRGKKIVFAHPSSKEMEILRILAEASEGKPISSSALAEKIYGSNDNLRVNKSRIRSMFTDLKRKLRKYGLIIASANMVGNKQLKLYYLADKDDPVRIAVLERKDISVTESDKCIEDENNSILLRGKKIVFARGNGKEIKTLRILAETSEENPISGPVLIKAVYGDEISLTVAKTRMGGLLPVLQKKLEEYDLTIARKKVEADKRLKLYYLADKRDIVEVVKGRLVKVETTSRVDRTRPPVKQLIPAEEDTRAALAIVKNIPLEREVDISSEKSLDKPPALAIAQIAALAIILRGSKYKPFLQECKIDIDKYQLDKINTIVAICRRQIGDPFYTDAFLKESFCSLAQYLKKLVEGNREAFLNSNNRDARTLLEIIPGKLTVNELEVLVTHIQAKL